MLLGGGLAVMVAQGTGRFILTPVLPGMQAEAGLDASAAGLLGSLNFAGYLLGAVAVSVLPGLRPALLIRMGLALVVLAALAMMPTTDLGWWLCARFLAGLGGALLFLGGVVAATSGLAAAGRIDLAGHIFVGVGIGIILGAVAALIVMPDWRLGWLVMAVAGAVALPWIARLDSGVGAVTATPGRLTIGRPLLRVALAYAMGGFGFGAGTTFFVRVFSENDPTHATMAWLVAGIIAAPSTAVWTAAASRYGTIRALMAALILHGIGLGLVAYSRGLVPMAIAGVLIGGTFMGVTALSLAFARSTVPEAPAQASAFVTGVFGLGQVLGPMIAGHLLDWSGAALALTVPALATMVGALALVPDLSPPPASSRPRV